MKKIKKFLILLIVFVTTFTIYIFNMDKKIYYISLGDSLAKGRNAYKQIGYGYSDYVGNYLKENNLLEYYTKEFSKEENRIIDIINDIEKNKKIITNKKEEGLKTILRKADLITLSVGINDIFYKLFANSYKLSEENEKETYQYIDEVLYDLKKLMELLRKMNKKEIIFIGYYNPITSSEQAREVEPIFNYIIEKVTVLSNENNIIYLDIYEIFKENPEYIPNPEDIHPSNKGYEIIASQIIDVIERNIIR